MFFNKQGNEVYNVLLVYFTDKSQRLSQCNKLQNLYFKIEATVIQRFKYS